MESNFVVEAVCSSLDMSVEEAQQLMFESEGQGFARLKVNELKNIIRDLKAQGYSKVHLSVTANKPALVDMLRAVAAAEKVNNASPEAPQIAQATPQGEPTHGIQLPPRLAVPPAAASGASRAANQPLSVLVPGPFSPPAQIHTTHRPNTTNVSNTQAHTPHLPTPAPSTASKSKKNKPKPASTHPGHTYIPKPGDDPNLQARLLTVLTSGHKIQAYKILREVEGVTENEILTELEGHSNVETLDVDELMFSIVMKRESATPGKPRHPLDALHPNQGVGEGEEGEEGEEEYDALLEQENRDMDAAIRESEKERDVIQQRKRARVEALRQGQDGFLSSGEYQSSVLLFGCPGLCDNGGSGGGGGGGSDSNGGGTTEEVQKGGAGSGGSGREDKSSGDGGGTTEEVQTGGASSVMAVNGSTSSGGSVVRNTLTKQVLHNALPTTSTTLHRSSTNTSTHSRSTNSDCSASSYAYSSAGGGYNSSSSVGTSSSNRNNSNINSSNSNIGNTTNKGGNSGSTGGNNNSSSVVDLTLDSESDSEPIVRKAVASTSSGGGSGSSNSMGNRTLTNGSCGSSAHNFTANRIPLATTTTTTKTTTNTNNTNNTNSVPPNTASTTSTTSNTNNTAELNKKPNMSRSVVVSTFARLLDELHSMQATSGSGSGGGCSIGSSGSSATTTTATTSISTSSGSSSGIQTKPINLYNRVYDITYLHHCPPHCITLLTTLRTSLSRILLLESNASKFYKNTSTAYMVYTARRIDGKLLCDSVDQAINSTFDTITITTSNTSATNTTSTTYADDCIYHLYHHYIRHTALVALLAHESDKLEKGMYKLQTDGSLVPYIFKKPRLAYYARVLAASIDTDGMEVVDVGSGNDNVSGGSGGGGSIGSSGSGGSGGSGTSNATLVDTSNTSNTAEPVDCCMWASSDESVASEYNSDEDDF